MPNLMKAKMIVLKKTKYSESDLIIHGLLESGIKVSLIAKGALASKKRFNGGVLEPTHHIEVQYQEAKSQVGLAILTEALLLHDFAKIRVDYERIETALEVIDWANHVGQESGEGMQETYHLLGHALSSLETVENLDSFRVHFMIRFLNQQGVLDFEPWMEPYLKTPMAKSGLINPQSVAKDKVKYLANIMQQYLGVLN